MKQIMSLVSALILLFNAPAAAPVAPRPTPAPSVSEAVLAERQFSLDNRHQVASVNEVFKKNIWLNLAYLQSSVSGQKDVDWTQAQQPTEFSVTLLPEQTFAYHDHVLPEYEATVALTTKAHFNYDEGFVSDGFLYGDGVCHLASLLNWAAQDAGLDVLVTKKHSIAKIPDVPDEYGVSIYTIQSVPNSGERNNLYITNNLDRAVRFQFVYEVDRLRVVISTPTAQGA